MTSSPYLVWRSGIPLRRIEMPPQRRPTWCATMTVPTYLCSNHGCGPWVFRVRPISPGSPWQNPYAERLIGTVRRECVDRVLIFGEAHLRQILSSYVAYYNEVRTHLALGKDAP